jgi:16S rRNA (cytidine1402-2'-O)-methyltransferase
MTHDRREYKPALPKRAAVSDPAGLGGGTRAGLHFVATPIGTARDITLRALDTLREADVIASEDTRTTRRLLEIHGIPPGGAPDPGLSRSQRRADAARRSLKRLQDGARVAYVSDAGTPLVADPGYQLARAAIEAGIPVTAAPGPSAALVALTLSGLPSDRFLFAGFPPTQADGTAQLDRGA